MNKSKIIVTEDSPIDMREAVRGMLKEQEKYNKSIPAWKDNTTTTDPLYPLQGRYPETPEIIPGRDTVNGTGHGPEL